MRKAGTWPSIDHSLLSPSGRVSKRARAAAMRREAAKLFDGVDLRSRDPPQPPRWEVMRRQAAELRVLASRGMGPKKFPKLADRLEAEADHLEAAAREDRR